MPVYSNFFLSHFSTYSGEEAYFSQSAVSSGFSIAGIKTSVGGTPGYFEKSQQAVLLKISGCLDLRHVNKWACVN